VRDLYFPLIGLPILLQENTVGVPNSGNIKIHRHMNVGTGTEGRAIPFPGIHKSNFLCSGILVGVGGQVDISAHVGWEKGSGLGKM
jgi:hypothetical protein